MFQRSLRSPLLSAEHVALFAIVYMLQNQQRAQPLPQVGAFMSWLERAAFKNCSHIGIPRMQASRKAAIPIRGPECRAAGAGSLGSAIMIVPQRSWNHVHFSCTQTRTQKQTTHSCQSNQRILESRYNARPCARSRAHSYRIRCTSCTTNRLHLVAFDIERYKNLQVRGAGPDQ